MELRKVMFKKWIARELIEEVGFKRLKEGTGCLESDFTHEGLFHQWGVSHEEFEDGVGNFTVAIVELPNGTIEQLLPSNLKFVDLPSY